MKLGIQGPEAEPEVDESERRAATEACGSCRREDGQLVYFRFRGSYCSSCAPLVFAATGMTSGGRRANDEHYPLTG